MQKTLLASSSARQLARTEYAKLLLLESIDQSGRQRRFGPDDRQPDPVLLGEADERRDVVGRDVHVQGVLGSAGVARRDVHPIGAGTLGNLPSQGVLAAAVSDDENVHVRCSCLSTHSHRIKQAIVPNPHPFREAPLLCAVRSSSKRLPHPTRRCYRPPTGPGWARKDVNLPSLNTRSDQNRLVRRASPREKHRWRRRKEDSARFG